VEVEQVPHLGLGGLLQGADLSPSGTVYQDIEAAMALDGRSQELS